MRSVKYSRKGQLLEQSPGIQASPVCLSEPGDTDSASRGNFAGEFTEVSRGHSSQMPSVMAGTG